MTSIPSSPAAQPANVSRAVQKFSLFSLLFLAVNLHLLRNLSPVYLLLPMLLYATVVVVALAERRVRPTGLFLLLVIFTVHSVWLIPYSCLFSSPSEVAYGAARMLFVLPLGLLSAFFIKGEAQMARLLRLFCGVVALGGASIIFQVVTGPIGWFVEVSERGGAERYGSLLGSITIMGVAGGLALTVLPWAGFKRTMSVTIGLMIIVGMLASLQKVAVVNLVLWPLAFVFAIGFSIRRIFGAVFRLAVFVVAAGMVTYWVSPRLVMAVATLFRLSSTSATYNRYALDSQIILRFTEFPLHLHSLYGDWSLLTGVGMKAGAGVFGIKAPMAHNGLAELLFMGGILYLAGFVALVLVAWVEARRHSFHQGPCRAMARAAVCFLLLYGINVPFTAGHLFQPAIASLFWCFVGYLSQASCPTPGRRDAAGESAIMKGSGA